jgi:hypothetical protein
MDSPKLTDFNGCAHLLKHGATASECKLELSTAPHCALLVFCSGTKVKIIHHPHHDVKAPVLQEGTDDLWALIGHGATALPVGISESFFNDHDGSQDFIKNDHLINPTQSRKSCVAQESNPGH